MKKYEITYTTFTGATAKRIERASDEASALGTLLDTAGDVGVESTFTVKRVRKGKQRVKTDLP